MKKFLFIVSTLIICLVACVKNTIPYVPPVNENFEWKTTEPVSISIPIEVGAKSSLSQNTKANNYATTVKIYLSPLYSEGSLIASGAAYEGIAFETVMDIAKGFEQVFVKIISPQGLVTLTTYDIIKNKAVKSKAVTLSTKAANENIGLEPTIPKPKFPSTYDVTINSTADIPGTFTDNRTYFIPAGKEVKISNANLFANWVTAARPVLYVQGSFIMDNTGSTPLSFSSIVILNGGSVVFKGMVDMGWTAENLLAIYVQKGGKLALQQGFNANIKGVSIVNEGDLIVKGYSSSILGGGALFYNTGNTDFTLNKFDIIGSGTTCYNRGNISANNIELNSGASFFNYKDGNIECANILHIDNNCAFKNEGTVESKDIKIVSKASFYNYNYGNNLGKVKTENLTMTNSENYLYQHGFFTVENTFSAKGKIDNYGKLECETITDGSTANFNSYKGSLLKTAYLYKLNNATFNMEEGSIIFVYKNGNGNGNGNGNTENWNIKFINNNRNGIDYALLLWGVSDTKEDNAVINSKVEVSFFGNIENYCPKKNDSQNKKYTNDLCESNAYWGGRDNNINETIYNEGLGSKGGNEPVDADGDGVPLGEDVDDNDPTVTHVSYFPALNTWGTYFFEDLWPHIGDYDMNDIVLGFRIAYYSKGELSLSNNNVVYMDINWKLRAVGSQMQLAFGVQLDDIIPEMVASMTNDNTMLANYPINTNNKGMESGQTKAVFALFNNPAELYGLSTGLNVFHDINAATVTPVEKNVRIRFSNNVSKDRLIISKINPFIVVSPDGQQRGREIHLSTSLPTDKLDKSYLSEGFLSENNCYKTTSGMVWGYMVPNVFLYPVEMAPINNAYPNFHKWYQSSGTDYPNWYDTSIQGNVVREYLYSNEWKK